MKVSGIRLDVPQEYRKMLLYRCIAGFACMGFAFYAMSQMVLADASCLVFSSPIMTFFFVRFSLSLTRAKVLTLISVGFVLIISREHSSCTRRLTP